MARESSFLLFVFTFSFGVIVFVRLTAKPVYSALSITSPSAAATELYAEQARGRKEMMMKALLKGDKSGVSDVFLPLVPEVFCPGLVRIGSLGDGGKWMCAPWMAQQGCILYSLGSRNDITFEQAFQATVDGRCVVRTVDKGVASQATIRGLKAVNGKYRQALITSKTDKEQGHYRIRDLMNEEGHDEMEFLKIDIEGAEHEVLPLFLSNVKICQIMIEIHDVEKTAHLLHTIGQFGYLLMHFEINAFRTAIGLSEFSFIHKDCVDRYDAQLLAQYLA